MMVAHLAVSTADLMADLTVDCSAVQKAARLVELSVEKTDAN